MKLSRPLVSFDLETTGTNIATDRIVQLAVIKLMPDGASDVKDRLINPGIPIPKGASDVHGITDEMVKDAPLFSQFAKGLLKFIAGCDLLTFNGNNFDIPLLHEELSRAGLEWDLEGVHCVDASVIFKKKEERTLSAALQFYCQKELGEDAHDALGDAGATIEVLAAQLVRYPDLGATVEEIAAYSRFDNRVDLAGKILLDEQGQAVYGFGKHKGKTVQSERSYAEWMLGGEFTANTKQVLKRILAEKK